MVEGPAPPGPERLRAGSAPGVVAGAVAGLVAVVLLALAGLHTSGPDRGARPGAVVTRPTDPPLGSPGRPLRIMPLGDSITAGIGSRSGGSYRTDLFERLRRAGLDVDFVGSRRSGTGPDPDHEGHGGWTVERITTRVERWLAASEPDVVLLHIGTNDVTRGDTPVTIARELSVLIDRILAVRPQTYVFVSQIVNSRVPVEFVADRRYNARILRLAAQKGPRVQAVRQRTFTRDDLRDTHHPNDAGYAKMAKSFAAALAATFPSPVPVGELPTAVIPAPVLPAAHRPRTLRAPTARPPHLPTAGDLSHL